MNSYDSQLRGVIRATTIHLPTTYSWFGRRFYELPKGVKRALTPTTARNYLVFTLQSQLYNNFYCKGLAVSMRSEQINFPVWGTTPFVEELSTANSGEGCWADGWEARTLRDDEIVVHNEGLELRARVEDCLTPAGVSIAPGVPLSLRFPKEFLALSPGFYMALSNKEFSREDSQRLVRFYLNTTAKGAVQFMQSATSVLNKVHLPFKLKVLNDPARFTRCDATVLYVRKSDYGQVVKILANIYGELVTHLKQGTPAFTKTLVAGLGLAEDPARGLSFGMHRCNLLAEGIIRAFEQGKKAETDRLRVVTDCFTESGINPEKPFLNPDSSDDYNFHIQASQLRSAKIACHTDQPAKPYLQTAYQIGRRLLQQAVWHEDRCNWLGAESGVHGDSSLSGLMHKTLGPEMYSGTSGVALFLAELFASTGDAEVRRASLGAIRQSLLRTDVVPPRARLGLYTGWIGIAFAAARVAAILGEEDLRNNSLRLLGRAARENLDDCEFDLLAGMSGAVAALVPLGHILNDPTILDFAVRLGNKLLQTANKHEHGYSWNSAAFPHRRNLTGFSHGTAGVGYALLELFHATGDSQYRTAAEQAFTYERRCFDAETGNWPDFREVFSQNKLSKQPLSFTTAWCHGAPGIALSRLRAHEILDDETCKAEAITALQTTREMIQTSLQSGTSDYSLCHGLAGNAEALLYGAHVIGDELTDDAALARVVGNIGIETYAEPGDQWPCGTGGGETPSLMLGLAGMGYFYLRLHDSAIPSILILRRESFVQDRKL